MLSSSPPTAPSAPSSLVKDVITVHPVSRPFQIVSVDQSWQQVQHFHTKWPFAIPATDKKSHRIAELLVTEVIPLFGVPEVLLSDKGTNLLSHLMWDVCKLLGIQKLNTTAHHPECDGMVERFNPEDSAA